MPELLETFKLYHNLFGKECLTDINNKNIYKNIENEYVKSFVDHYIDTIDFNNYKKFFIFSRSIGYIYQLEDLNISEDIVNRINNYGLDIFLYEIDFFSESRTLNVKRKPLNTDRNTTFLDHVYGDFLESFENVDNIYSVTLDSIDKFVKRFNLKNVSVKYLYFNTENLINKYNFKIDCFNVCLPAQARLINQFYKSDKEHTLDYNLLAPFWRYDSYRHLLACYLARKTNSKISWHYDGDIDILKNNIWFDLEKDHRLYKKIVDGHTILDQNDFTLDKITHNSKTVLDGKQDKWKFPPTFDGYSVENTLVDFYKKSFCVLAGESVFAQHYGTISEKSLIPIMCKNSFIVVGAPHSLKYLKSLGFKTFNTWWDESYDDEENHEKRLKMILELVDYIDNLTKRDKEIIYNQMNPVLEYNYQKLQDCSTFSLN